MYFMESPKPQDRVTSNNTITYDNVSSKPDLADIVTASLPVHSQVAVNKSRIPNE
jgi:hypothetical protein